MTHTKLSEDFRTCMLLFCFLLFFAGALVAQQATKLRYQHFELVKVADGIFAAIQVNALIPPANGNSVVLINDKDVLVVDANLTPAAARLVLAEIRTLTDKPVRYVVNTHWHFDHILGNQAYQDAFPHVEFIAHQNTREDMEELVFPSQARALETLPRSIQRHEEKLAKGAKASGEPMNEEEKAVLTQRIESEKHFVSELAQVRAILPSVIVKNKLTLYRGDRTIEIRYLGRGNTRGDLVVYLPKEKVLITGDLLINPIPASFGSYLTEWIQVLKELAELDAETIIPGHGPIQRNKEHLKLVTSLLECVVEQVQDAVKRGLSLEETLKAVDLEPFRILLAGDDPTRNRAFSSFFVRPAIQRAYQEATGNLDN